MKGRENPVSENITYTHGNVSLDRRRALLGHGPATVWFTGLSGSGKSTLAFALEAALADRGVVSYVLDGDNIRHALNADLGFSPEDRVENIRRVGEVCKLFTDAGQIVLSAFISPYAADRAAVRDKHPPGGFFEVFVSCSLAECERRDVKGLYQKARSGAIPDFSGVSAPYEIPVCPDLILDTATCSLDLCVTDLLSCLEAAGVLAGSPPVSP